MRLPLRRRHEPPSAEPPPAAEPPVVDTFRAEAELPYALVRCPGARHLLVTYPAMTGTTAPPLLQLERRVGDLRAHRLYIGADRHGYVGPGRSLAGSLTSAALTRRVAEDLGVAAQDVATYGSSFRGLAALHSGLTAGVGLIVSGAPAVRIGTWALELERSMPPDPEDAQLRATVLQLIDAREPAARAFWDELILETARASSAPTRIRLFTSPTDEVADQVTWLADELAGHPTIDCRIAYGEYPRHADIKMPFFQHLRTLLIPFVEGRPEPRLPGT